MPGHGYNLRQTAGSDGLISFTGSLVNGDILFAASSPYADAIGPGGNYFTRAYVTGRSLENLGGKGWNLLGNPYASAIVASEFIDANYNVTPSLSQFDPNYVALYLFDGSRTPLLLHSKIHRLARRRRTGRDTCPGRTGLFCSCHE